MNLPRRSFLTCAAAGLTGCGRSRGEGRPIPVREFRVWPVPPGDGRAPGPRSLACAPDGTTYAVDEIGRVLRFSMAGRVEAEWKMPETSVGRPEGVVVLRDGRIAVSDTHYHRVVIFRPDGAVDAMFGREGQGAGEFIYPVAITETPDGRLAVAEYGGNDRVQLFRPDGRFLSAFGSFGTAPHQLQRPSGVKEWQGRFFVADAMNNRVQVYTGDGTFERALPIPALHFPYDLHRHPRGGWCVVEYGGGRVTWFDEADGSVRRYGRPGRSEGEFLTPWGLAVSPVGHILVADTGNKRVVELVLA